MLKIGITGGIGSGKSFVAKIFEMYGIPVYYADKEAKRLMYQSQTLKSSIKDLLGNEAYHRNGRLNRPYIASKIFAEKKLLKKMNGLVHPAVKVDFLKWAERQTAPYVLEESAIIFENGLDKGFDKVILVVADKEVRIQRVMKRDKISKEQVKARMKQQFTDEKKVPLADYIIDNSGGKKDGLIKQLNALHHKLLELTK